MDVLVGGGHADKHVRLLEESGGSKAHIVRLTRLR
jgi:hypothetical protein